MREDSSTRSWDAVADDWVAHADTNDYRNHFLLPFTLALLGDVRDRRILDLGCGEGGYGRALAARGARVVAVDGSARLVEVARRRAEEAGQRIECLIANAAALEGDALEEDSFDIVLASMMLMDVEDYEGVVREVWRVLARGGFLLMSITHPCFSAPVSRWVSEGQPDEHFAVDRYLQPLAWDAFMAAHFRRPVIRRHRPLQDYVNPLLECGFALCALHEPAATAEQIAKSPRLERLARIPYFLFMRWEKPDSPAKGT
jgi:2-polyprenyl-3-methyl-5-hydroxy-6-metoxy-1,4-benzoquinol methylase